MQRQKLLLTRHTWIIPLAVGHLFKPGAPAALPTLAGSERFRFTKRSRAVINPHKNSMRVSLAKKPGCVNPLPDSPLSAGTKPKASTRAVGSRLTRVKLPRQRTVLLSACHPQRIRSGVHSERTALSEQRHDSTVAISQWPIIGVITRYSE
jgi:hypothetical protein